MDVYQPGDEVGIDGVGSGVEHHLDRPGDLDLVLQHVRGVDQNILTPLDRALVAWTRSSGSPAAVIAAYRGSRVVRIVAEAVGRGRAARLVPGQATVAF